MGKLNNLDKELVKDNYMDIDSVREKLHDLSVHDISNPDYGKIRSSLFPKNEQRNNRHVRLSSRRGIRRIILVTSLLMVFITVTTAIATHLVNVWVKNENEEFIEAHYVEQSRSFKNLEEFSLYLSENGLNLIIPCNLSENFSIRTIQDTDFGLFRTTVIHFDIVENDVQLQITMVYEFEDISDVKFLPVDIAAESNMSFNGVDIVFILKDEVASSFWRVGDVVYMLNGRYSTDELEKIVCLIIETNATQ